MDMDIGFGIDDIPSAFSVYVYSDSDPKQPATFDNDNVHEINLYFEYSSNDVNHAHK